jgi:hypothetical protein
LAIGTTGDVYLLIVISRSPVRILVLAVINGQQLALNTVFNIARIAALILPLIAKASFKLLPLYFHLEFALAGVK